MSRVPPLVEPPRKHSSRSSSPSSLPPHSQQTASSRTSSASVSTPRPQTSTHTARNPESLMSRSLSSSSPPPHQYGPSEHASMPPFFAYEEVPTTARFSSSLRIKVPGSGTDIDPSSDNDRASSSQDPQGAIDMSAPKDPHFYSGTHQSLASRSSILGEPITFGSSPSSLSSTSSSFSPLRANFDKITSLPTPVIGTGSFGSFGSFRQSTSPETLDIVKQRSPKHNNSNNNYNNNYNNTIPNDIENFRVVSEYKPVRQNSLLGKSQKRFASNPTKLGPSHSDADGDDSMEDASLVSHRGSVFHSDALGKDFEFVEEIGSGNFSKVALARSDDDDLVAVKIISIPAGDKFELSNFKSYIRREVRILQEVSHPSIVRLLDYQVSFPILKNEPEDDSSLDKSKVILDSQETLTSQDTLQQAASKKSMYSKKSDADSDLLTKSQLIFLSFCPGGNLFQFASLYTPHNSNNINYWYTIRRIIAELIIAVAYLHSKQVVHRDIKLENVLLTHKYHDLINMALTESTDPLVNLTDFGISKQLSSPNQMLSTRCGSQDYIAPELLMGLEYNGKLTDSWAVGVLIYAILEDRLPFDMPPLSFAPQGVSPSVIRRKRAKHNTAHRIAMIDWDWYSLAEHLSEENTTVTDPGVREILGDLKEIVESLLVRKDKRKTVGDFVEKVSAWVPYENLYH